METVEEPEGEKGEGWRGGGGGGGFHCFVRSFFLFSVTVTRSAWTVLVPSFFLSLFHNIFGGAARRGQGEMPRAVGGPREVAVDGERERTVYNIAMIQ